MSVWKARRFWTEAREVPAEGGFAVALDGRPLRTPARAPVVVPTEALACALAEEWQAQSEVIDPHSMPRTRMTNSAIDTVARNRAAVFETVAAYGDCDLLCYRASHPEALVARQAAAWDPLLTWAEEALSARLEIAAGVMHRPQPPEALAALRAALDRAGAFELAALHELVALSGSLVIGLRVGAGGADPAALWEVSRLDEHWQAELWGRDDEAEAQAETRREAFLLAAEYHRLARG